MGPGIVQRMGALVYRVISAGRCVPVRSTVYKAGKYVLFTGCNQLLPRVGNLENHFILFREKEIVTVKSKCFLEKKMTD